MQQLRTKWTKDDKKSILYDFIFLGIAIDFLLKKIRYIYCMKTYLFYLELFVPFAPFVCFFSFLVCSIDNPFDICVDFSIVCASFSLFSLQKNAHDDSKELKRKVFHELIIKLLNTFEIS